MKILTYYLPQFHRIPENDQWWGDGFTEWRNVKKAKPLFDGHNQPRVPLNDNYYDLTDIESVKGQAKIAKEHGIYGFCIYHYWFDGKLLLEKPIELIRDNKCIDINFCLCWANENWNNGWVSSDNKTLISSDFNDKKDWVNHIKYFLSFFKDERYIKIDGKPLVVIYYPSLISKRNEMISCWRNEAKKAGFKDLCVVYQHSLFALDQKADKSAFDYGIEFEPGYSERTKDNVNVTKLNKKVRIKSFVRGKLHINFNLHKNCKSEAKKLSYDTIWKEVLSQKLNDNIFPGAFVDWDNTIRKGQRGSLMIGASPEKFEKYFKMLVERTKYIYKKDLIFLFAWNEWGESGYLEPDKKNGYGYLNAIKKVLDEENEIPY